MRMRPVRQVRSDVIPGVPRNVLAHLTTTPNGGGWRPRAASGRSSSHARDHAAGGGGCDGRPMERPRASRRADARRARATGWLRATTVRGCRSCRHLLDGCAGEVLDDLQPTTEPSERELARSRRTCGKDHESAADAPRPRIGHQRDPRGGAADELHLAQIENDQVRVALGRPQRPVGLRRRGDVELAGEHDLDDAAPKVARYAAEAGSRNARNGRRSARFLARRGCVRGGVCRHVTPPSRWKRSESQVTLPGDEKPDPDVNALRTRNGTTTGDGPRAARGSGCARWDFAFARWSG